MRKPCGEDSGCPAGHLWILSSPQATQTLVGAAAVVELSIFRLEMAFLRARAAATAGLANAAPLFYHPL